MSGPVWFPTGLERARLRDRLVAAGCDPVYADLLAVVSRFEDRDDVRGLVCERLGER